MATVTFIVPQDFSTSEEAVKGSLQAAKELIQTSEEGSNQGISDLQKFDDVFATTTFNPIESKGRKLGIIQQLNQTVGQIFAAAGKDIPSELLPWKDARPLVKGLINLDNNPMLMMSASKTCRVQLGIAKVADYDLAPGASATSIKIHAKNKLHIGKYILVAVYTPAPVAA